MLDAATKFPLTSTALKELKAHLESVFGFVLSALC